MALGNANIFNQAEDFENHAKESTGNMTFLYVCLIANDLEDNKLGGFSTRFMVSLEFLGNRSSTLESLKSQSVFLIS